MKRKLYILCKRMKIFDFLKLMVSGNAGKDNKKTSFWVFVCVVFGLIVSLSFYVFIERTIARYVILGQNDPLNYVVLQLLPYLVLLLLSCITFVGAVYLRRHMRNVSDLEKAYGKLETQNQRLEKEVEEKKLLYDALHRAREDNAEILNSVRDIIFEVDASGKMVYLNAAWTNITGFSIQQSLGLVFYKMLHPDEQETHSRALQDILNGQPTPYRSFTKLRTSEGTFRAVELTLSMIRTGTDKERHVVGTFTDVEERRRVERALGEAEKKYRKIVENAAGGIFQLTPEGLYLSANPSLARILGYENVAQMLREIKNANESVYANLRQRQNFLRKLETAGEMHGHETQVYRRDKTKVWVKENIRVVRDDAGNVLYYEGSMEDITEQKNTVVALKQAKLESDMANRAKSEFLANMSHELRTPLNAIIGFSEIIHQKAFGPIQPDNYAEYVDDIYSSGQSLLRLINEILDISRIDAGERQLTETRVNLFKLSQNCLDLCKTRIEENEFIIVNEMALSPEVIAEELALKQVFMNLLTNALKFTPRGGHITLTSDLTTDGDLAISVTDTGIGLDKADIEKALSPFGQLNNELDRENSGTGLGLSLVQALMKLHGGYLELFSEKSIGTTATIVLPKKRVIARPEISEDLFDSSNFLETFSND